MTKSTAPCAFCESIGSLSTEHVMPKWLCKALLPFIGGSLPLAVALGLVYLAGGLGLGPLEFAGLPLADLLLPRAFPLYFCPQPVLLRHADPCHGHARISNASP